MKVKDLREMSDEQLELTAVDASENLFRMRVQSQTERMNVPSQIRLNRKMIARVRTIQTQRIQAHQAQALRTQSLLAAAHKS